LLKKLIGKAIANALCLVGNGFEGQKKQQKLTQQHNWKIGSSSPREAWAGFSSPREASVSERERDFDSSSPREASVFYPNPELRSCWSCRLTSFSFLGVLFFKGASRGFKN
jgi:hypothetical protein